MAAAGAASLSALNCGGPDRDASSATPSFLRGHEELYRNDPRAATLKWFQDAKFGLFIHYGVYSQLGRGERVQFHEKIPVAEYGKLKETFSPEKFNAGEIADLAVAAGMKYINLTARHHDSFSLFRTNQTGFTSLGSQAGRDLVEEMAEACAKRGIGLFLYYSYALDWRHPYFYSRDAAGLGWAGARPGYEQPEPEYLFQQDEDFVHYLNFVHSQLEEILYRYSPLAGIWLDPVMGYYSRPDLFPIGLTYQLVREAQPAALIGFKQGANGDEDFVACERTPQAHPRGGEIAALAWERNQGKPIEICDTLQPRSWGYDQRDEEQHRTSGDVMRMLEHAGKHQANLLLNTGLLPGGSIHPEDIETLLQVGKRLAG